MQDCGTRPVKEHVLVHAVSQNLLSFTCSSSESVTSAGNISYKLPTAAKFYELHMKRVGSARSPGLNVGVLIKLLV